MNIGNIRKLADAIERQANFNASPLGFNMVSFVANVVEDDLDFVDVSGHSCETVACIAGWSVLVSRPEMTSKELDTLYVTEVIISAREWLGLTKDQGYALFYARGANEELSAISAEWAVATLRRLAVTGEVDWTRARPDRMEHAE